METEEDTPLTGRIQKDERALISDMRALLSIKSTRRFYSEISSIHLVFALNARGYT